MPKAKIRVAQSRCNLKHAIVQIERSATKIELTRSELSVAVLALRVAEGEQNLKALEALVKGKPTAMDGH